MLPVAWMWRKFRFASSHTARSATRSFSTCAPSDPPNETITICPGCTPRARRSRRSARNISARTGLPTTTVLSGAPRRSTASGMAASTALACFANILFVTPGKRVLLMNGRGDAAPLGSLHHRPADIAARANHKARLHLVQNRGGTRRTERQMIQSHRVPHHILRREFSLNTIHLNGVERVACPGDKAIFHAFLRPAKCTSACGHRAFISPAMASAGLMCPAVPPAAINTFINCSSFKKATGPHVPGFQKHETRNGLLAVSGQILQPFHRALPRHVQHYAHFTQKHDQRSASRGKNGRLMPVLGMVLVTTAIFSAACSVICTMTPTTSIEPNLSRAFTAT